jgi:hypothetical protein
MVPPGTLFMSASSLHLQERHIAFSAALHLLQRDFVEMADQAKPVMSVAVLTLFRS